MNAAGLPRRSRGFLVIAAVFLVVVLAALAGYLMTVSTTSQAASAADANSARAYQAARAGIEWAAYQVLRNSAGSFVTSTCAGGAPTKVDLAFTFASSPYTATVTCTSTSGIAEGASTVTTYAIKSSGCNESTCPNTATTSAFYAERELRLTIAN
jgi:MSHA biogenesis protein MshP